MSFLTEFERLYDPETGGWHMPPWLDEEFNPALVKQWREKYEPWFSPVEREVGRFYRSIVNLLQPSFILETGTNAGYSTYCLAKGLEDLASQDPESALKVISIDVGDAHHLFKGSEVEKFVSFIQNNSLEIEIEELRGLVGEMPFDLLVLDSDHSYKTIIGEINRFAPELRTGGVLILHDSMIFDGIALVVRQLMAEGSFEVVNLPTPRTHGKMGLRRPGITIARKLGEVSPGFLVPDEAFLTVELNLPDRKLTDQPLI